MDQHKSKRTEERMKPTGKFAHSAKAANIGESPFVNEPTVSTVHRHKAREVILYYNMKKSIKSGIRTGGRTLYR